VTTPRRRAKGEPSKRWGFERTVLSAARKDDTEAKNSIDSYARLVALVLATHMDPAGRCRLGLETLQRETGLVRNTIIDRTARLERYGVLKVDKRHRRTNRYQGLPFRRYLGSDERYPDDDERSWGTWDEFAMLDLVGYDVPDVDARRLMGQLVELAKDHDQQTVEQAVQRATRGDFGCFPDCRTAYDAVCSVLDAWNGA
jgi:hypothetical protein